MQIRGSIPYLKHLINNTALKFIEKQNVYFTLALTLQQLSIYNISCDGWLGLCSDRETAIARLKEGCLNHYEPTFKNIQKDLGKRTDCDTGARRSVPIVLIGHGQQRRTLTDSFLKKVD